MRWFRIILIFIVFIIAGYWLSMYYFVEENKSFKIEKEINYPIDKVYPQFNDFQNFTRWNHYFSSSKSMSIDYYTPYTGTGSSISFQDVDNGNNGEMFLRYENPNKTLKYQLFENDKGNPTNIDIKFIPVSSTKTKIIWYVKTPKKPVMTRLTNLWTEEKFIANVDKSMANLRNMLGNKIEKDELLTQIKYDSLMIEKQEGQLVLGINVTTSNKKDALYKNIIMNHNKVYNFVTNDLGKNQDEIGFPILINSMGADKGREVSYFLGIPLSNRIPVTDNNFSFKTLNESQVYTIYYKGMFPNRTGAIQKLMLKAKKDTLRTGELQQIFLETPEENKEVLMKITLPVYK